MRTIKFRVWDKVNKKMINLRPMEATISIGSHLCFGCEEWGHNYEDEFIDENFELIQFTGLKDKNGKEIYERDILAPMSNDFQPKYKGNWIVDFEGGTYIAKCKDGKESHWLPYWSYDIYAEVEIIGNIYENPELLK